MKQVLQNLKTGKTESAEVPAPTLDANAVLIQTRTSLISAGTERMLVQFGKSSLLAKARSQPDKVRQTIEKIKTDGILQTADAVLNRLAEPLPLGYCNAGIVVEVGSRVKEFTAGDRVASNGSHAELVAVGKNLCARIPDGVTDEEAAFAVLASVGLQGIRLLHPELGERIVVYGLGLIGLLSVQMLRAHGCEVLGIDVNNDRLKLAEDFGAKVVNASSGSDLPAAVTAWSGGSGADAVLIAASAESDDIIRHSARMCRKRGRIVLVGVVGLNIKRADFYDKELTFQVSCSYGPGRYDERYEKFGEDYPIGFVRWTEQRNFEAVLQMMASGRLVVDPLITHRFPISGAEEAYTLISKDSSALGVILQYPGDAPLERTISIPRVVAAPPGGMPKVGVIGAGNFSTMTLLPALKKCKANVAYVADLSGAAAHHLASKYGASKATSDYQTILKDADVAAVIIAVGHSLHARLVCEALQAGKHLFVEKPLALTADELGQILAAVREHTGLQLMVGFNRRFSSHVTSLATLLRGRIEPLAINIMVNAGAIPPNHWVQDPVRGGGRIVGEACHFMDLMVFLTGSLIQTVSATMMGAGVASRDDKMCIALGFEDGSIGTINYFANGSKSYPKETIEVFSEGRVGRIDNFRRTKLYGLKVPKTLRTLRQEKGHKEEIAAFLERLKKGGEPLIPLQQLVNVTLASFAAMKSAAENRTICLADEYKEILRLL